MIKTNDKIIHNQDISLLVVSCDAYSDLWRMFFQNLFKYWPDCPYTIYLGTNQIKYNDSRVKSILIGPDKDYSSNLILMLNQITTPWIILWIEDLILSAPINTARLSKLINQAKENKVGYIKLGANTPWAFTTLNGQEIGPLPKGIKYRCGIGLALWNKETLLKLLCPGESAWQIERNGSKRSNHFKEPFFALSTSVLNNIPISYINTVVKGKWNREAIHFLKKEEFEAFIPNRPIQSIWSYLYSKLYHIRLNIYRRIGKHWYEVGYKSKSYDI